MVNVSAWAIDFHRCEFCLQEWDEHEKTCPYHPTPSWDRDNPTHDDEDKDQPPERWRDRL